MNDKVQNFDAIIEYEWLEVANYLMGSEHGLSSVDPVIRPYLEPGAHKTLEVLLLVMNHSERKVPIKKRAEFRRWCMANTDIAIDGSSHKLCEVVRQESINCSK